MTMKKSAAKSRRKPKSAAAEPKYNMDNYARDLADSLMGMIATRWEKPWDAGHQDSLEMPYNAHTGKSYRGGNAMRLLATQMERGYTDNRWLTWRQAVDLGAKVQGDQAKNYVRCVKWIEHEVERKDADGTIAKEKRMVPTMFCVYNAAQVDGLAPEPPRAPIPEVERHEACEQLLARSEATIHYGGREAYYRPSTDSIHMPPREAFVAHSGTLDHFYATAFHEMAHSTGAPSRLNRDLTGKFGTEAYAKEELRAEIASMLMGERLGIGRSPEQIDNHKAYLKHWLQIAKDDPREIFAACSQAEKISEYLGVAPLQHTPTVKAPVLDQALVERGAIIADMHGLKVVQFDHGSPQEEALGKGWGHTGSATFHFVAGGFASREACFQAIAEKHGASIQNQIPRNVQVGMDENGVWTPYKIIDILDSGTAVVMDERNRDKAPALIDLAALHAEEDGQRYRFQDVVRGVEIAQQGGMRVGRDRDDHGWQLYGTDSHPVLLARQPTFATQLAALDWLNSNSPKKTDRDLGEDLRQRLRGAQAFGSREAGEAWEGLVQQHGNEYDAVAKTGAAIRDGSLATQEWPQAVRTTIQQVRQDNGLERPERRPEPALSL